jgi:hypothetical protein
MDTPDPPRTYKKPLARSLGEFFGILADAVKTDVEKPRPTIVREAIEEVRVETAKGSLTLRRRVIDEVERVREKASGDGSPDASVKSRDVPGSPGV